MSGYDAAMGIYVTIIISAFFVSFTYGTNMTKKTGVFIPHMLIACVVYMLIIFAAIAGWFIYSWGKNEFLFIGGLWFGLALLLIGEILLVLLLLLKRKGMIQTHKGESNL